MHFLIAFKKTSGSAHGMPTHENQPHSLLSMVEKLILEFVTSPYFSTSTSPTLQLRETIKSIIDYCERFPSALVRWNRHVNVHDLRMIRPVYSHSQYTLLIQDHGLNWTDHCMVKFPTLLTT